VSDVDEFFDLLDEYALGTLAPSDCERVRRHLETCAACTCELDELRNVFDVLPHALDVEAPNEAARERLLRRLDPFEPGASVRTASEPVPLPVRRRLSPWIGALAAGFALALLGDVWLAWQLQAAGTRVVAVVTTASPSPIPSLAPTPSPAPSPSAVAKPTGTSIAATPRPAASPAAAPAVAAQDAVLRARLALLQHELAEQRELGLARDAQDRARIAALTNALARKSALVAVAPSSAPSPTSAPASAGSLVAALSNGRVYAVDGDVGTEHWHLTIVQPPAGANAEIFSDVPHAPPGETYRTWVLRGGKTFDAGELPAGTRAKLDMPMPLQSGDVVAFSREAIGSGNQPTSPFLMELTIKN
jgi:hypothetical protein